MHLNFPQDSALFFAIFLDIDDGGVERFDFKTVNQAVMVGGIVRDRFVGAIDHDRNAPLSS